MKLKFEFKSLRDMSYNHALVDDCLKSHAQYAIDNIAGFPESLPPEARAELVEGAMLRHNEMHPPVEYALIDGHYLPLDQLPADAKGKAIDIVKWNPAFALTAFSQQAFGALKQSNLAQWQVLEPMRVKAQKYASGKIKSLEAKARMILKEQSGESKTRSSTAAFADAIKKVHDDYATRCKNAKARGDETADEVKYRKAIDAFNAVWLK